mmetsp:Transcript_11461/g.21932  ORF Transcript_11461/g.21932 Transcript_11461/m.21932 type:complete len:80 (-) Transcript_11461:438-677(-)|eukprot:scaffold6301_cov165-Amphora_coffeaeformis.AAC.9
MFTRLVLKRTLATVARPTTTKAASSGLAGALLSNGLVDTLLGIAIVVPSIIFAPAHTFDNLDCNGDCYDKIWEDIPDYQ